MEYIVGLVMLALYIGWMLVKDLPHFQPDIEDHE